MLRGFGMTFGCLVIALFGLIPFVFFGTPIKLWPWVIGGAAFLWGLAHPSSLFLPYRAWMALGAVLGAINSRIILGCVFFMLITPIAIILRLMGRSPLSVEKSNNALSYLARSNPSPANRMEVPY
jgi:hypothetical protein